MNSYQHDAMICIECTNPEIECLYSKFKSKYIQLTICQKCGKLADKYIEYDYVILFLDVMLLKPQAYRHLAFNVVEESMFGQDKIGPVEHDFFSFILRYKKLMRYALLTVLFEVYLKWAYEEIHSSQSMVMVEVLRAPVSLQYAFFILQQLVERSTLCLLLDVLFRSCLGWGSVTNKNLCPLLQRGYYVSVLLLTVLMSHAVKCLPIIMLIWPYDNAIVASAVVDLLGFFNTVEALKINTRSSFLSTFLVVFVATCLLIIARKVTVSLLLAYFCDLSIAELISDEIQLLIDQCHSLQAFFHLTFIQTQGSVS